MYNYQTFLKQHKLKRKCDQLKKEYYDDISHKQKIGPSLIHSHKKRVQGFLLTMVEKPNQVDLYTDNNYQPRKGSPDYEKVKAICHNEFNLASSRQKPNKQSKENSLFDTIPFNNTFSHRFRDLNQNGESSLKPMRYKPINNSVRIKDQLQSKTLNQLPNMTNRKIDKLIRNPHIQWRNKECLQKLNRSLLPTMHKKTYFQSLKTIFSESPTGFLKNTSTVDKHDKQSTSNKVQDDHVQSTTLHYFQDEETENQVISKKEKMHCGENINWKSNSREALIKCGLMGGKRNVYRIGMEKSSKKVFSATQNLLIR